MPRPISSRRTRLRSEAPWRIAAVSFISTMKVDWLRARLSEAPTRVKTRSQIPRRALPAGTKEPICAMSWMRPTWRSTVLFPAMFGPVRITMRPSASRWRSLGMKSSRGIIVSTTGCRPATTLSPNPVVTSGRTYPRASATSAMDNSTSRMAIRWLVRWIRGTE